ncbi:major histocompatibility complex class I-related gene protein-like [Cyprinodon tularosa]|uniref:major histocompatibility complex class I-related gene protein-like n=1 Tax=Cyprinodon tularosa TaxID=77115 RepID=UPI0018E1E743|nr:major histocompatibility complex class I-related gene protein-like [Cyprinodon tularosa]
MKQLLVTFLCIQATSAVIHSWKAFYTGTTGLSQFPEFVAVNLVNDELMGYFDSKTNRFESKQSWMTENLGQEYDEQQTNILLGYVPSFSNNIKVAMQRFNQSQGVHIFQYMYGCEWDADTGEVTGYQQYGYDGEDFLTWNTNTWVAPKQQAVITTYKWNNNRAELEYYKNYLNQLCPEWLKKYVNYGRSSLMRTDRPSVSFLQKSSSSQVSCFATGFYPSRAEMFWRKDGAEIHDGVEKGEILPNNDGTFQMSVDLNLPSSEDGTKYECVFQLSGDNRDVVTPLDKTKIRTNEGFPIGMIIGVVIAALLVLVAIIAGVVWWKKRDNALNGLAPCYLSELLHSYTPSRSLRQSKYHIIILSTSTVPIAYKDNKTKNGQKPPDVVLVPPSLPSMHQSRPVRSLD